MNTSFSIGPPSRSGMAKILGRMVKSPVDEDTLRIWERRGHLPPIESARDADVWARYLARAFLRLVAYRAGVEEPHVVAAAHATGEESTEQQRQLWFRTIRELAGATFHENIEARAKRRAERRAAFDAMQEHLAAVKARMVSYPTPDEAKAIHLEFLEIEREFERVRAMPDDLDPTR